MEFASLDGCVKSHEQLQKEYQKLLQMFDEVERENESRSVFLLLSSAREGLMRLRSKEHVSDSCRCCFLLSVHPRFGVVPPAVRL